MNWLEEEVNKYYDWLKQNTFVQEDENTGWGIVTLPFTGLFNDNIEIYAKREGDNIILSDDGDTISHLQDAGLILKSPKRKNMLYSIARNYGISVNDNGELTKTIRKDQFPQGKLDILQAIMEVSDLKNITTHNVSSLFKEDVRLYLREKKINAIPQMMLRGKSNINFTFDFMISTLNSECLIDAINNLDKARLAQFLFGVDEVKSDREKATEKKLSALTIVNDVDNTIKGEFTEALTSRGYDVLRWSERNTDKFDNILREKSA